MTAIAGDTTRERISVAELMARLEHRAIAALIFVFALPNVIPLPPGVSTVLGAPLLFLTAQLALGLRPWLPEPVSARTFDASISRGSCGAWDPGSRGPSACSSPACGF